MQSVSRLPVACLALLCLAAPAGAATAAPLGGPTAVRELQGIALVSAFDRTSDTYRLATVAGGTVTPIPGVPSQAGAFDADIGSDSAGQPEVVFSADVDGQRDLFVVGLDGAPPRPVSNVSTTRSEVSPTLDAGRVGFVRIYGSGTAAQRNPVVYVKALVAPRSRPSTRLPGVPQRRCGDFEPGCGPTTGKLVEELELSGPRLAMTVHYGCRHCSGISQTEVRQDDLRTGRAEQIAFQVSGLSGQNLTGLSYSGADLAFYRSCGGDTSGCLGGKAGPRLSRRDGAFFAATGPARIGGFAFDGSRAFEVLDCGVDGGEQPRGDCRLERSDAISFAPAKRPLRAA